jgi:hypothetical protein
MIDGMNSEPQSPLIALIEDEEHLAQGLLFNLEAEGYRTTSPTAMPPSPTSLRLPNPAPKN